MAVDWARQMSVPQKQIHSPCLQNSVRNLQTLEVSSVVSRGWEDMVAGAEERPLSWESRFLGSSPPLPPNSCLVASVTEQGRWINCRLRPRVLQAGRGRLAEDPGLLAYSPAAPGRVGG